MKQIFEKIAEQIAYNTKDVATMLTMIAGFMYGKFMLTTDRSPALLIILAILIFCSDISLAAYPQTGLYCNFTSGICKR